ncbi:MAG: aromatic ring-hydroxylating dioxygenase subunit alpha [Rhodospirillales bacterium]|jgi:carnitine monooxygenase subunit|nr:aromatic ring-hydroxylating dioxygenase subunit alpha [Rhodospirillales bacterium]MBT4041337.1 aromatic ring-hydroxylating dioxygenase subunit alpha [Rhodospirillales bacterium]MBT4626984.1 aromatic ring-hydroxylating dioxygenase subunit alpha [Rhodospirillales bacterium]MBT5351203.1 aromatic ring-hydroxylating dioxygenase subunit alpha [Rhodospirillales bacterium]MBT5520549.1 aromatic ring-hydroxylating dioxygenase subunit alpha [Rhodospirillales bacterium]
MTKTAFAFGADEQAFTRDRRKSFTIPARYYSDPSIYEAEKGAVFHRNWWLVGHVTRFPEVGSYVRVDVQDQGVLVIKGRDGELRAFYNVCQHRGHEMVKDDDGRLRNLMVCPYHAWAYDFEGSLVRARNTEELPDFDKCNFGLKSVKLEVLADFVYVNLDPDAESLNDLTPGIEEEMRYYMPQLGELEFAGRVTYEVGCNWKVLIDNFLECYHCAPAHPALVDLMDMDTYTTKTYQIHSSHIAGAPLSVNNAAYSFEKGDVDFGYAAWYLWPNLTIWAYPGEPLILTLQIVPTGPETSIEYLDCYTMDGKRTPQLEEAIKYMDEVLQPEDIGLCESVQKGLRSNGYNQGRFVVDETESELSEHAVHHFQEMLLDALDRVKTS